MRTSLQKSKNYFWISNNPLEATLLTHPVYFWLNVRLRYLEWDQDTRSILKIAWLEKLQLVFWCKYVNNCVNDNKGAKSIYQWRKKNDFPNFSTSPPRDQSSTRQLKEKKLTNRRMQISSWLRSQTRSGKTITCRRIQKPELILR